MILDRAISHSGETMNILRNALWVLQVSPALLNVRRWLPGFPLWSPSPGSGKTAIFGRIALHDTRYFMAGEDPAKESPCSLRDTLFPLSDELQLKQAPRGIGTENTTAYYSTVYYSTI